MLSIGKRKSKYNCLWSRVSVNSTEGGWSEVVLGQHGVSTQSVRRALQASLRHISNPPHCQSQISSVSLPPLLPPLPSELPSLHQGDAGPFLRPASLRVSHPPPPLTRRLRLPPRLLLRGAAHDDGLTRVCAGPRLNIKVCSQNCERNSVCLQWFGVTINNLIEELSHETTFSLLRVSLTRLPAALSGGEANSHMLAMYHHGLCEHACTFFASTHMAVCVVGAAAPIKLQLSAAPVGWERREVGGRKARPFFTCFFCESCRCWL